MVKEKRDSNQSLFDEKTDAIIEDLPPPKFDAPKFDALSSGFVTIFKMYNGHLYSEHLNN